MCSDMHTRPVSHASVMQKAAECLHSNARSEEATKEPRQDSYSVVRR